MGYHRYCDVCVCVCVCVLINVHPLSWLPDLSCRDKYACCSVCTETMYWRFAMSFLSFFIVCATLRWWIITVARITAQRKFDACLFVKSTPWIPRVRYTCVHMAQSISRLQTNIRHISLLFPHSPFSTILSRIFNLWDFHCATFSFIHIFTYPNNISSLRQKEVWSDTEEFQIAQIMHQTLIINLSQD